jgi:hypothetical protein
MGRAAKHAKHQRTKPIKKNNRKNPRINATALILKKDGKTKCMIIP